MTKYKLPDNLYPYQLEDAGKMSSNGRSWLNFSEMGVGKTPETLQVIESMGFKTPLIVCPNSLRLEWDRQISEWVGENMTAVATPDSYQKLGPIVYSFTKKDYKKYRVVNYEALRVERHLELLNLIPFDCIIFDEIHKLRNPKTKQVTGTWKFLEAHQNAKIVGLSGSPIMNYPNDLYVPLSVVDREKYPRTLERWRAFMYKYCLWSDGQFGPYIYGTRRMNDLRQETAPYVIRRTKKEVLPFLPEKFYKRTLLEMKPDQRKLYNEMETQLQILLDTGEPLWSTNVLSTLTRLRQINLDPRIVGVSSSSAKTEFILETVEGTDEKLVIFSCFEKYVYWLSLLLDKMEVKNITITGQVPPDERSKKVKEFQEDGSIRVCLGTLQTMGEGVTLTAASNCIFADRWWNQPTNLQGEDRLHRIGQHSAVQIILPVVNKSIDALLDEILERKNVASQEYYQEGQVRQSVLKEGGLLR